MRNLLILMPLFFGLTMVAQRDIETNLGDFNEIKVFDLINVELVQANENRAVISGDNSSDVELVNKNGTLRIRMRLGQNFVGNKTVVTLYFKNLDVIDANEGTYVTSENSFKQYQLELRVQEGAIIKVPIEVTDIKVKAVTGGEIEVVGKATRQDIAINTGGIYDGQSMTSESAYVAIRAAGEAHIKATKLADINIRAGGDVFVYGQPEKLNENKFLGGRIKMMD